MAYCVPLRFIKIGPDVSICATRIVAIISTDSYLARLSLKNERKNKTLINGCGRYKCVSAIFLDNGAVVSSPYSVNKILRSLDKANNKEMNPRSSMKTTKYRVYEAITGTPEELGATLINDIAADELELNELAEEVLANEEELEEVDISELI